MRSWPTLTSASSTLSVTTPSLEENQRYFWRVAAHDGITGSSWNTASFIVNSLEEAPPPPTIANPSEGGWVEVLYPVLSLNPSSDPDGDTVHYEYEVYGDAALTTLVISGSSTTTSWVTKQGLQDNSVYFWRGRAVDSSGRVSSWSHLRASKMTRRGLPQVSKAQCSSVISISDTKRSSLQPGVTDGEESKAAGVIRGVAVS